MEKFLISSNKEKSLVDRLCQVESKECDLTILSCYIHPDSIISLVDKLKQHKNLKNIRVLFDEKEVSKISFSDYKKIQDRNISIFPINTKKLFHPKAYCLTNIQKNDGVLCISSANLTLSGLTKVEGNTEIFLEVNDIQKINNFLEEVKILLKQANNTSFDELINSHKSNFESLNFKCNLLNCGKFFHQWNEKINQILRFSYTLNNMGIKQATSGEFNDNELTNESKTVGIQYFDLDDINQSTNQDLIFSVTKNYVVDTCLGYWIPNPIAQYLEQQSKVRFDEFKQFLEADFNKSLEIKSNTISKTHQQILFLTGDNKKEVPYIEEHSFFNNHDIRIQDFRKESEDSQIQRLSMFLRGKAKKLIEENDIKLKRIYTKFYISSLPYIIEDERIISDKDIKGIQEIYLTLEDTVRSQIGNTAKKAVKDAISEEDITLFDRFNYLIKIGSKYIKKANILEQFDYSKTLKAQQINDQLTSDIDQAFKSQDFKAILRIRNKLSGLKIENDETPDSLEMQDVILSNCKIYKQWCYIRKVSDSNDFLIEVKDIELEY